MQSKTTIDTNVGISISPEAIEGVIFSKKDYRVEKSVSIPTPPGILTPDGDYLLDSNGLANALKDLLKQLNPKNRAVHLSLPATLLRLVEMPRISASDLYISLSSEAERYKTFDDTEAVVDFVQVPNGTTAANMQRVAFGAVRKDTLDGYQKAFQAARIKIASADLEPLNVLRGMAGTGVLDALVRQIGAEAYWGSIFVSKGRVHFFIWQGNTLYELREVVMDTNGLANPNSMVLGDLVQEIQRTTKSYQPAIWLTHNVSDALSQALSQDLGVPFRPCVSGAEDASSALGATGAAMHSWITFPFDVNLLVGATQIAAKIKASPEPTSGSPSLAVVGGVMTLGLVVLVWAGLSAYTGIVLGGKIKELDSQKTTKLSELASLNAQRDDFRRKAELQSNVYKVIQSARARNVLYVDLTTDLQQNKIPGGQSLWLRSVTVDDKITLAGRSKSHQAVLDFARNFDGVKYAQSILVNSIKEKSIHNAPVFDYEIGGKANADPKVLLNDADAENAPEAAAAAQDVNSSNLTIGGGAQ